MDPNTILEIYQAALFAVYQAQGAAEELAGISYDDLAELVKARAVVCYATIGGPSFHQNAQILAARALLLATRGFCSRRSTGKDR